MQQVSCMRFDPEMPSGIGLEGFAGDKEGPHRGLLVIVQQIRLSDHQGCQEGE
jgi:hypothetical protein